MEPRRFDELARIAFTLTDRRSVLRLVPGALAVLGIAAGSLDLLAANKKKKKQDKKKKKACPRAKRCGKNCCTGDTQCINNQCVAGCAATGCGDDEQCCTGLDNEAGFCAAESDTCCDNIPGGATCIEDAPKCCPPNADAPEGSCTLAGNVCCDNLGGGCPANSPTCCPPGLKAPQGYCLGADRVCCPDQLRDCFVDGFAQCCPPNDAAPSGFCAPSGSTCCDEVEGSCSPANPQCCANGCIPSDHTCCGEDLNSCPPEVPQCCPPVPDAPKGFCTEADSVCCPDMFGACSPSDPVCCPATPAIPFDYCCPPDEVCTSTVAGCAPDLDRQASARERADRRSGPTAMIPGSLGNELAPATKAGGGARQRSHEPQRVANNASTPIRRQRR